MSNWPGTTTHACNVKTETEDAGNQTEAGAGAEASLQLRAQLMSVKSCHARLVSDDTNININVN